MNLKDYPVMKTFVELKISSEDFYLIANVKKQVEEIYEQQGIFGLSLETLELTRRFNKSYNHLTELIEIDRYGFNKFLDLTRHLERNLLRELN